MRVKDCTKLVKGRLPQPGQLSCKINSARATLTRMACAAPLWVQAAPHWCSREMAENSQKQERQGAYGVLVNSAIQSCFRAFSSLHWYHEKTCHQKDLGAPKGAPVLKPTAVTTIIVPLLIRFGDQIAIIVLDAATTANLLKERNGKTLWVRMNFAQRRSASPSRHVAKATVPSQRRDADG